ncbi:hypothetical protein QJS04_geneDACA021255 [Acorus gramineus]|uniref:Uncharacterized protein n=1 Tax=Acorus gramineus TaxID=55184 RepID=A0AAV9BR96_ACOGR|nr:hypothetical protein QJS04_geneDACA021255 [Acorus gramineus]
MDFKIIPLTNPNRRTSSSVADNHSSVTARPLHLHGTSSRHQATPPRSRPGPSTFATPPRTESSSSDCRVVAQPRLRKCCGGGDEGGRLCMNIEEVKACRDLGFEIPFDWTVEIAGSPVAIETSSGGESSPISNWRISSPGEPL